MATEEVHELEQSSSELLEQSSASSRPRSSASDALVTDPAIYEEAAADPGGLVAAAGDGAARLGRGADARRSTTPTRPSTSGSPTASSTPPHNCLDRHVEAGNGDRVAFHWRGEEGEERDVTYAELLADIQRFANALKDRGIEKGDVVGIYLPMIPEVVVAMLACARIGAPHNVVFGGFSAESVRGADGVLRGEGAGHRRRRPPQGQDGAGQAAGRRGDGRPRVARDDRRRPAHRDRRARCRRAATSGTTR